MGGVSLGTIGMRDEWRPLQMAGQKGKGNVLLGGWLHGQDGAHVPRAILGFSGVYQCRCMLSTLCYSKSGYQMAVRV